MFPGAKDGHLDHQPLPKKNLIRVKSLKNLAKTWQQTKNHLQKIS